MLIFQNIKQKNDFNSVEFVYNFNTGTREPTSADLFQFRVSLVSFRNAGEAEPEICPRSQATTHTT